MAGFGKDAAPGIDDQRMAERLAAVLVHPALRGGDDEGAVLDGAGAQQQMPVRLPGLAGEGGGHGQHFGAGQRLGAEKLREAQIVADGEAELGRADVDDQRLVAGLVGCGFAPALAIVEIDVEHVDLVVAGGERAIRREQQRAVGDLAVGAQNGGRADMQEDAELRRQPPGGGDDLVLVLSLEGKRAGVLVAHDRAGHLGRLHIGRALAGRLAHQRLEIDGIAPAAPCRSASGWRQP